MNIKNKVIAGALCALIAAICVPAINGNIANAQLTATTSTSISNTLNISQLNQMIANLQAQIAQLMAKFTTTYGKQPNTNLSGGSCTYKTYTGNCAVTEVISSSSTTAATVRFAFALSSSSEIRESATTTAEIINKDYRIAADNLNLGCLAKTDTATPDVLKTKCGIESGKSFKCQIRKIKTGTCTPMIYNFLTASDLTSICKRRLPTSVADSVKQECAAQKGKIVCTSYYCACSCPTATCVKAGEKFTEANKKCCDDLVREVVPGNCPTGSWCATVITYTCKKPAACKKDGGTCGNLTTGLTGTCCAGYICTNNKCVASGKEKCAATGGKWTYSSCVSGCIYTTKEERLNNSGSSCSTGCIAGYKCTCPANTWWASHEEGCINNAPNDCTAEGGIPQWITTTGSGGYYKDCCAGLTKISDWGYDSNCNKTRTWSNAICVKKCGDRACTTGETKCNCPVDCAVASPTFIIASITISSTPASSTIRASINVAFNVRITAESGDIYIPKTGAFTIVAVENADATTGINVVGTYNQPAGTSLSTNSIKIPQNTTATFTVSSTYTRDGGPGVFDFRMTGIKWNTDDGTTFSTYQPTPAANWISNEVYFIGNN